MTQQETGESPLEDALEDVAARLVADYRVRLDESGDRATVLDPPPADATRLVRLVPDGTDGESLSLVLTAAGGAAVHVRRTLDREFELPAAPAELADDLQRHVVALARHDLGWTRR